MWSGVIIRERNKILPTEIHGFIKNLFAPQYFPVQNLPSIFPMPYIPYGQAPSFQCLPVMQGRLLQIQFLLRHNFMLGWFKFNLHGTISLIVITKSDLISQYILHLALINIIMQNHISFITLRK